MRPTLIVGVLLILLGIFALVSRAIEYKTEHDVIKLGDVRVTAKETKQIPLSPILGVAGIAAGAVLVASSRKRT